LVTIVVPAKDEQAAIGATLRALPVSTLRATGFAVEVIVLDGHSRDGTAKVARQWGACVVPDRRAGKAAALRDARHLFCGDYVVMLDADGTYAADSIPRLLGPLARGDADVVAGRRVALPGSMTPLHRVGNSLLSLLAAALYGRSCPDLCTGLWGFRAEVLRALPLRSHRFGLEAELFALCSRLGLRVASVDADYLPRQGVSNLRSGRDGLRILRRLLGSRFTPLSEVFLAHQTAASRPAAEQEGLA
jgi:dolichol-phosphate mannosyltransferase